MSGIQQASDTIINALREEFAAQGHTLTGKLEESIVSNIVTEGDTVTLQGFAVYYEEFVNDGVPASKIPYSGNSGAGGESQYIQALIGYAKLRFGVGDKEATSIAFAIAHKHMKEGMPTASSAQYSKTGERIGAVQAAFIKADSEIDAAISLYANEEFDKQFQQLGE